MRDTPAIYAARMRARAKVKRRKVMPPCPRSVLTAPMDTSRRVEQLHDEYVHQERTI